MIIIDSELVKNTIVRAHESPRKRAAYTLHNDTSDVCQRLLNALHVDTYAQPHKHEHPDKDELLLLISGCAAVLMFEDFGDIADIVLLNQESGVYGVQIPPREYHTILSLQSDTVVVEVKQGPYNALTDKCYATWAPAEDSKEAGAYLKVLRQAVEERIKM